MNIFFIFFVVQWNIHFHYHASIPVTFVCNGEFNVNVKVGMILYNSARDSKILESSICAYGNLLPVPSLLCPCLCKT